MKNYSIILILFVLATVEATERSVKRPGFYGHHHLLYYHGIFYYLAFLAVKIKIVLLIGAVITAMVFVGKVFAIIKYGSNILDKKKEAVEEKIVIERPQYMPEYFHSEPSHDHHFNIPEHFSSDHEDYKNQKPDRYSIGPEYFSSKYLNTKPGRYSFRPESYDSKEYYKAKNDKMKSERYYNIEPEYLNPKNRNNKHERYSIRPENYKSKDYKTQSEFSDKKQEYSKLRPEYYGSHIPQEKHSRDRFNERSITSLDYINQILTKINLTDMTFNLMGIEENSCKKRFICEVHFMAKENKLIRTGFELFSNFQMYETSSVKTLQDCSLIYPNCVNL